jgi:hypothetical protein
LSAALVAARRYSVKTRTGFVSNSSSSSFIIDKNMISMKQYQHLLDHIAFAKLKKFDNWGYAQEKDQWSIYENEDRIECSTDMDNFNLHRFAIEILKIDESAISEYK